jgi:hypothetical protein
MCKCQPAGFRQVLDSEHHEGLRACIGAGSSSLGCGPPHWPLEGQEATVLQLPAQTATAAEAEAQERVAHVG